MKTFTKNEKWYIGFDHKLGHYVGVPQSLVSDFEEKSVEIVDGPMSFKEMSQWKEYK